MNFVIQCSCGRELNVTSSQAGMSSPCDCGLSVPVPSLRVLRDSRQNKVVESRPRNAKSKTNGLSGVECALLAFIAIVSTMMLWRFGVAALFAIGYLYWMVGRIWVACLMVREMNFSSALLVFFIPFGQFYFAFVRIDVAWKAVILSVTGLVLVWGHVLYGISR